MYNKTLKRILITNYCNSNVDNKSYILKRFIIKIIKRVCYLNNKNAKRN